MFNKKQYERCRYCSKFLTDEQKNTRRAFCTACASNILVRLKKSFMVRAVFGILCVVAVLVFIHHVRVNAYFYGEGVLSIVRVPTSFGYLNWRVNTFNSIMNFSIIQNAAVGALAFMFPFLRRVRFGMDAYQTFSQEAVPGSSTSSHPYLYAVRGNGDRMGVLISELMLSLVSGPYFFVHGLVAMGRMRKYTCEY